LSTDIRKGILLSVSLKKQAWQILSFNCIENQYSLQHLHASITTVSIALLKFCIDSYWSVGRKPGVGGNTGGGIGARTEGSGSRETGGRVGSPVGFSSSVSNGLGGIIDNFWSVEGVSNRVECFLVGILGFNISKTFLLLVDFVFRSRQYIQFARTLLVELERSFKKEGIGKY
jgi:hypothetical protein